MADLSKLRYNGTDYNVKDASAPTRKFTNYSKTGNLPITSDDTIQSAIGKLENAHDINKANILYNLNMGVKNLMASLLRVGTVGSIGSTITFELQGDGSIVLNGSTTNSVAIFVITETGRWATSAINGVDGYFENISYKIALFDGGNASSSGVYLDMYRSGWAGRATCGVGSNITYDNPYIIRLCVPENKTLNNVIVKPMVCTLDAWNQSTDYQLPSLPNYDLTRLEAEDRAELVELVDNWAKNEFNAFNINAPNARGLTFTYNHDGSITITGNNDGTGPSIAAIRRFTSSEMSAMAGYILSGVPSNTVGVSLFIQKDASPYNNIAVIEANETAIIESVNYSCTAFLLVPTNTQNVNVTVRPMICSKPKYTISPKYIFNGYKQPVKHSNITAIEAGGYAKLGKLVNVVIRCSVGSECAAYTELFRDLPVPASGLSAGANFAVCASNQSVPIIVCANGSIQNGEVLPATSHLLISVTYICL